ncbi:MAG: HD domain-containing protein [Planctomycetes bacterium]|nr:HD domain-containing protein [Planctomycetota bacterium]
MPRTFITNLGAAGTNVDQVFLVAEKDLRTTKKGGLFISAKLRDRTGEVPGIMWDASQALFAAIPQGGYALVKGRVGEFNDLPQIVIEAMRPVRPDEVDLADFLPTGPGDPAAHLARLRKAMDLIERPALRALMDAVWADEPLVAALRRAPAAEKLHHAYLGGLLEHTLSMAELGVLACRHYPKLDRDLLLVGVFWHDLGKTRELHYAESFGYTDSGKLVGHIVQAVLMLEEKIAAARAAGADFPDALADVLRHLLLAHHGQHEFGSPKLPMTAEAFALHHLDNLDAKLHAFWRDVAADADPSRRWTSWNRMFEGALYKGFEEPAGNERREADAERGDLKGGL